MNASDRHMHDWADAVGAYLLGALPDHERAAFEAHLDECPVCREDVEMLRVASDALPASVEQLSPPPELKARIMAVVEAEAELMAAASGSRADLPDRGRERARGPQGWFGRLAARPAIAVACVALLLVGGVTGAIVSSGTGGDGRTVGAKVDGLAQNASAELILHKTDSKLAVEEMPSPPEGRIYQVWIKRKGVEAPEPTSALFVPRADGRGSVAVPGSMQGVEAVLVTDEPEGGSTAPTRSPVIIANLS